MRSLKKNQQTIYYSTYSKIDEQTDNSGYKTGLYKATYAKPVMLSASVSAARGTAETELFGANLDYDKTVIVDNPSCPITETAYLWIDTLPTFKIDGTTDTPHNYKVMGVAKSINHVAYAVKKVSVANA